MQQSAFTTLQFCMDTDHGNKHHARTFNMPTIYITIWLAVSWRSRTYSTRPYEQTGIPIACTCRPKSITLALSFSPERRWHANISFSYRSTRTATPEIRIARFNVIKSLCACARGMRSAHISVRQVLYLLRQQVINLKGGALARTAGCCSIQMKQTAFKQTLEFSRDLHWLKWV